MTRQHLPNRRPNESIAVEFEGARYTVTIGYRLDGAPAEVFCHGARSGSAMDRLLDDACVTLSLLLQHGVDPAVLAHSMGRLHNGDVAASVIGTMVDLMAAPHGQG